MWLPTQRALRDILMSRGKNCLPIVSRQFLTRNYPGPNRLLKCLPNCLSPTGEGIFSSFKITPAARVIARQLRDKNCPGAIFQERRISPKRKFWGRTSRGHPGVIRADIPAQNFGQGGENPGKTSIWARTSMTRRRGRPRP